MREKKENFQLASDNKSRSQFLLTIGANLLLLTISLPGSGSIRLKILYSCTKIRKLKQTAIAPSDILLQKEKL